MSLYIEVDDVSAVLLADGWHVVADNSFEIDAYEFHHKDADRSNADMHTGATWLDGNKVQICCPLTSILAVRLKRR